MRLWAVATTILLASCGQAPTASDPAAAPASNVAARAASPDDAADNAMPLDENGKQPVWNSAAHAWEEEN